MATNFKTWAIVVCDPDTNMPLYDEQYTDQTEFLENLLSINPDREVMDVQEADDSDGNPLHIVYVIEHEEA